MLTDSIVLANSGHNTLRPLDIWLGHLQIVYVELNTVYDVLMLFG